MSTPRLEASGTLTDHGRELVAHDPGLRALFSTLDASAADRFPSEAEVARITHCSIATIKRRLRERLGVSYRDLRELMLARAAARTLADPLVPIKAAARRLGYGSARAFDRAFVRWYGSTPGEFRKARAPRDAREAGAPPQRAVVSIDRSDR